MGKADLEALAQLHVDVWTETYSDYMPTKVLEEQSIVSRRLQRWQKIFEENNPKLFIRLAKVNGELAGFVTANISPRDNIGFDSELMAIDILKKFHRLGIGKKLMASAFEFCQKNGARNIYLWVAEQNLNTINFYRKLGGKLEPNVHNKYGIKEVLFSWQL